MSCDENTLLIGLVIGIGLFMFMELILSFLADIGFVGILFLCVLSVVVVLSIIYWKWVVIGGSILFLGFYLKKKIENRRIEMENEKFIQNTADEIEAMLAQYDQQGK